jgi:hypothetical protein
LQLLQLDAVQVHVVPPLGMLPTVHVPPPELEPDPDPELEPPPDPELEPELEPDDPELEPLAEPELEPDDPELDPLVEPDEPELELLAEPELEVEEPELEGAPELEPLDAPEVEASPSVPNDPPLLPGEDEHEASAAMTAGRTRRTLALIVEPSCGVGMRHVVRPPVIGRCDRVMGRSWQNHSHKEFFFTQRCLQ